MEIIEAYLTENPCYGNNLNAKSLYDSGVDKRYWIFQQRGPKGGMLHSVGCPQPNASVFISGWNDKNFTKSCVHGIIDANTGTIYQLLPWDFRGWHCGGSGNNTMLGVEMCESGYIRYKSGTKFEVLNKAKARADCKRAYDSAVWLFATLSLLWNWNPDTDICSHKEGYSKGIASGHGDPEHYWQGLGMDYTMNGFRADVKAKMEELKEVTREDTIELFKSMFPEMWAEQYNAEIEKLHDNDAGQWSEKARAWAIKNGIVAGVGQLPDGTINYAWKQPLTREQFVQIAYRERGMYDD